MTRLALSAALLCLFASRLAGDSVDLRLGAGPDSGLAGAAFSTAMEKDGSLSMDGNLDFNTITHTAKPDETTDASLKLLWNGKQAWSGLLSLDGTDDTRNATSSGGGTLTATWTLRQRDGGEKAEDAGAEVLALTFGAGLHDYKVDLGGDTVLAYTQSGQSLDVDKKGILTLPQFTPTLGLEVPFMDGRLTPSLTYTYYRYADSPTLVANVVEQEVLLGPGAGRVYSLVAQFYRQSWNWGLALDLPWDLVLTASWTHSELVTGSQWQDMPSLNLAALFGEHWTAHLAWSSVIVRGLSSPQTELGAGYLW